MGRSPGFANDGDVVLRTTPHFFKTKMCGFGSKCRNGESCRFAHSTEELRSPSNLQGHKQMGQECVQQIPDSQGIVEDQGTSHWVPQAAGMEQEMRQRTRSKRWCDEEDSSDSDSAEGSAEGRSQGPCSDRSSNRSGTTRFTGESGDGAASGGFKDGRGGTDKRRNKPDTELSGISLLDTGTTTLLMSNIPTFFTQGSLLAMLEDLTPTMRGSFDFFHCPPGVGSMRNSGHAKINFTSTLSALTFQQEWSNKVLCRSGSGEKRIRIKTTSLQGLEANLKFHSTTVTPSGPGSRPLFRDENGLLKLLTLAEDPRAGSFADPLRPLQRRLQRPPPPSGDGAAAAATPGAGCH